MLFLSESASYYGFEEGVTIANALIEQMEATQAVADMEVALLEADYLFHTQVLTEEEQADPNSASGGEKKASFLQRVIQVIKNVIEKIKAAVMKVWNAIKSVFKKKVAEKETEAEEVAKSEGVSKADLYFEGYKNMIPLAKGMADLISKYLGKVKAVNSLDTAKALKTEMAHAFEAKEKELKKAKAGKKEKIPFATMIEVGKESTGLQHELEQLIDFLEFCKKMMDERDKRLEAAKKKEKPSAEELSEYARDLGVVKQQLALAQRLNGYINHVGNLYDEVLSAKIKGKDKGKGTDVAVR